ncbi:MAG: Gfo/Idh/MocA family oxidoreductase [Bacteroidota bacterium]
MKAIQTALLSFGMSGRIFHAPFLEIHPGFELVGSFERSQKNIQKTYSGTHSYDSLDEVIQDSDIELIIVNTPIPTHFEYASKALKAGKHVVVEKAFTNSTEEAFELQKIAHKVGKHIFVYQNRRWDSDFLTLKKVYESGQLGEIVEAEFHFDRYNGAKSPKMHKEVPGPGAGIIFDLGPHIIDQALHLFGKPTHVFADLRKTRPGTEVEDLFEILLYYPEMRVRLKAGYYFKVPIPAFQLHGKLGSFIKTRSDRQEADLDAGRKPQGDTWGQESPQDYGVLQVDGGIPERIPSEKGNFMAFYENVFQSLRGDANPAVSVQDGINSMRVIDAAMESSREKKVITY